ncbi:hypothetical protein OG689_23540 [Kitasatospora sp. NBC_00240]|uniref:SCO2583/SCO2584 N-terminal domain-containing protein n=1 Tax=Kitasatospora sp. NBC_00240 TaxID=2903567 RepID=UPI0022515BA5|nr:hypothetical protein [Kitasatospora sp. NBC_00240]MCX5212219.1 hypothetical protein [Kitasatospora sp. NBC_00240]
MPIVEDPDPRPSEGSDPNGSDPFENLVLDEEFVKGATVKEQAGRTRMLAARWKDQPPVDPGARRTVLDPTPARPKRRLRRAAAPVDAWGTPRRGTRDWRAPLFVLLIVVALVAALNLDGLRDRFGGARGGLPASAPSVAPETARPTTAPPSLAAQTPTVDHPWAGSPAEGWPAGPDAIALPPAQAVGAFDAEQVAAQLKLVKDFLVAANLDPAVIAGGRPQTALDLLDREEQDAAVRTLDHPDGPADATSLFSRFDPRDAIPVGDVRILGRMSVEGDGERGVLVRTDFTFVYALRPGPEAGQRLPGSKPSASARPAAPENSNAAKPVAWTVAAAEDAGGSTRTARTVVRRADTYRFQDPARYRNNPKKINFAERRSEAGNTACEVHDGFYHPRFEQFAAPGRETPHGPTTDPYDRSTPAPAPSPGTTPECGTVSRS